jgi:4-amino-4-deoxy-L-arabinose transferase-like glycosyltransferase
MKLLTPSANNNPFSFVDFTNQQNKSGVFLIVILIIVCLYDLLSPPISVTIWRQAQTAMLTDNFMKEGFSLRGLYVGLNGHDRLMTVYEFPIYNFIVGLLFKLFGNNPFWGKLVSLFGAIITLVVFCRLVKSISNDLVVFYASLFFIFIPVNVLMFTSFQPDALGLMFLMLSIFILDKWRSTFKSVLIIGFSVCLLLCGLCKYPLLVPYIPLLILMYFFPKRRFRFPRPIELVSVFFLFMVPFVSWYLYRAYLTDPSLSGGESGAFLFGDLSRFLSPGFYVRPSIMLVMLVLCGSGCIYFLSGLRKMFAIDIMLLIGIPLYFIVVPTVTDQYYYLYAIAPIAAFFMARGVDNTASYLKRHHAVSLSYVLGVSFMLFSIFGITYVLRMDRVILPASESIRQVSAPDDLIFVVNMHDRGVGVGGHNPAVVYFTGRNGWNIQDFTPQNFENIITQINSKRDEGAKWLVVTWYTPDLEPWYSKFLPKEFNRLLKFDSKNIADKLKMCYPVVRSGDNYVILKLVHEG